MKSVSQLISLIVIARLSLGSRLSGVVERPAERLAPDGCEIDINVHHLDLIRVNLGSCRRKPSASKILKPLRQPGHLRAHSPMLVGSEKLMIRGGLRGGFDVLAPLNRKVWPGSVENGLWVSGQDRVGKKPSD